MIEAGSSITKKQIYFLKNLADPGTRLGINCTADFLQRIAQGGKGENVVHFLEDLQNGMRPI